MTSATLKEVAPSVPSKVAFEPREDAWHLNLDQIESGSGRILEEVRGPASDAGSSTIHFDEENVLYSKLRPYLNKVVCPNQPGIATSELVPLRPDPKRLTRDYLTCYLRSPDFVTWVSNEVAGAKMPRVSMKTFWQHEIPLPPLAEQKRIAKILDVADALRTKRRESLEQLDTLLQSTFLEMFGDVGVSSDYKAISEVCDIIAGQHIAASLYSDIPNGTPYLTGPSDFGTRKPVVSKWTNSPNVFAKEGDVLVTVKGSGVGKLNLGCDAAISRQLMALRPRAGKITQSYLLAFLKSVELKVHEMAQGAAIPGITKSDIASLVLYLPPLDLQNQFALIVESVEQQQTTQREHLEELDTLFAALQQRAFNGELTA